MSAEEPAQYPEPGEPEDYVEGQPHDGLLASAMPAAWELLGPVVPLHLEWLESPHGGYLDRLRALATVGEYPGLFLSRATYGQLVVGEVGRAWLTRHAGEWVRFCEVEMPQAGSSEVI